MAQHAVMYEALSQQERAEYDRRAQEVVELRQKAVQENLLALASESKLQQLRSEAEGADSRGRLR
eukprot:4016813-Lingulodinium_polyedra.AAC.1